MRRLPHYAHPRSHRFALHGIRPSLGVDRWHYRNGTQDGEQIKIVSMMNHPNYAENIPNSNDFMTLELERPSAFKPVKLAAADDSDFKPGTMATTMGWGKRRDKRKLLLMSCSEWMSRW
ncbi:Peptidase S1, PA clan [Phytophthora cactorum]|nr:Peptidase S1, PA clan [Phytophthora cactorum]